jgi:hypothetical protein
MFACQVLLKRTSVRFPNTKNKGSLWIPGSYQFLLHSVAKQEHPSPGFAKANILFAFPHAIKIDKTLESIKSQNKMYELFMQEP